MRGLIKNETTAGIPPEAGQSGSCRPECLLFSKKGINHEKVFLREPGDRRVDFAGRMLDADYTYKYQPPVTVSSQKLQEYDKIRVGFEQGRVKDIKTTVR